MRMKLNKSSQLLLVSAASLLVAGLLTACGTLTVDFVFVSSSKAAGPNNYGEIDVFEVNSESGVMRQIPTSPFPSGGRNPVAEAVSSDNADLYVVNHDDNTIVQFVIGNDGKLYPQNTVNTPGVFPMAVAVSGSNLFVVDTYQPLPTCSPAAPCSGSIAVFPITPGNSTTASGLGDPVANPNPNVSGSYWPLSVPGMQTHVIVPTAVTTATSGGNTYLYVSAYDSSETPNAGYVFGFWVTPTNTTLSAVPSNVSCLLSSNSPGTTPIPAGTLCAVNVSPVAAGVYPSAIAGDSAGSYLYVTDFTKGNVLSFAINGGSLTAVNGSPFPAGNQPSAIIVDPKYPYLYVANSLDSTVEAYSINSGALSYLDGSSSPKIYSTGSQPTAIGIDPSSHHYLYTANFLGGTMSSFQLSSTDGTLIDSQFSPYAANAQPTAIAAIPHGSTTK